MTSLSFLGVMALALAAAGVGALVFASVGIARMPDCYTRMHAAAQARTLGISTLLLSVAVYDWNTPSTVKVLVLLVLVWLTTPIAAYVIGRAAYRTDVRRTELTRIDDLAGAYERDDKRVP